MNDLLANTKAEPSIKHTEMQTVLNELQSENNYIDKALENLFERVGQLKKLLDPYLNEAPIAEEDSESKSIKECKYSTVAAQEFNKVNENLKLREKSIQVIESKINILINSFQG